MSVSLTTPLSRGSSNTWKVSYVGANWDEQVVVIRVTFDSGDVRDYRFAPQGGFATIGVLASAVPNFQGLRGALESYLSSADPTLAGTVT